MCLEPCADMCTDTCLGMCVDVHVDMCRTSMQTCVCTSIHAYEHMYRHVHKHVYGHVHRHVPVDMCLYFSTRQSPKDGSAIPIVVSLCDRTQKLNAEGHRQSTMLFHSDASAESGTT